MRNTLRIILSSLIVYASAQLSAQTAYDLQKALQTARTNNPVLKTEAYNVGIAQADVITAGLRPNLTLNNQSLQMISPKNFPANAQWYDGRNRQIWWQLTKTFQLPSIRRNKMGPGPKKCCLQRKSLYRNGARPLAGSGHQLGECLDC